MVILCFVTVGVPTFDRNMEPGKCALAGKWARMHLSLPPMPMWAFLWNEGSGSPEGPQLRLIREIPSGKHEMYRLAVSQRRNDWKRGPESQRSLRSLSGFSTRKPDEFCGKEKGIGVVDPQNHVTRPEVRN